jgi:LAGLIDADG DNA endonuclease family protein
MRSYDEYREILKLWELGINKKMIARVTGIPRATIIDCIRRYGSVDRLESSFNQIKESSLLNNLQQDLGEQNAILRQNYAYLLGLYLGDGCITKARKVYRLRIALDASYPGIIDSCAQAIQVLLPENQVGLVKNYYRQELSYVEVSSYYLHWPDVFPQHGVGTKHTRLIQLESWQQSIVEACPLEFFRGLYHSDGSRFSNIVKGKDYPRYQFTNYSNDIRQMFSDTCDQLGLHWTTKIRRSRGTEQATDIFISRRKDVEYLDQFIGPKS